MFLRKLFGFIVLVGLFSSSLFSVDYDLSNAKYSVMDTYKAEAFAANDIYAENDQGKGNTLYYTDSASMTLLEYEQDVSTGFNAGLYRLNNGKYIIAFGGTTATSKNSGIVYSLIDSVQDVIADLNLLNSKKKSYQPYQANAFLINMSNTYKFTKDNLTLTGHSLGGGLAQYVSYLNDYKAITFNTAPLPIPYTINLGEKKNVINIMSNKDPLTATLLAVEATESRKHNITHAGELLNPISDLLNKYDRTSDTLKYSVAALLSSGVNGKGIIKDLTISLFNNESNMQDFLNAITALKDKKIKDAVVNLKKGFALEDKNLTNLMLGKRVVLNTNTGHGMLDMIKASYRNIHARELNKIKQVNPEFYKYIDGTFKHDGVPFPTNSRLKDSLISRLIYYYYSKGYEPVLDAQEKLLYARVNDIVASQTQIENFSKTYLKLDGLLAQGYMSLTDPYVNGIGIDVKTRKRIASTIVDSGKGEFLNFTLTKGEADAVDAVESCIEGLPWFDSIGGMASEALEKAIKNVPQKVLDCALGQTVQATGRFVNTYRGSISLKSYNAYRIAHKYLDRYTVCGINNNQCVADAFGGKTELDDQLQNIMDKIGADGGAFDWIIKREAKHYIDEYQQKFIPLIFNIVSKISIEVQREFNHGNRHTNTLDGFLRVVDYDEVENILWVNLRLENTSGREIMLTSFLPLIVSEGVETNLGGNTHDDISYNFLGQTLKPNENRTFKSLPINLGDLKIKRLARVALLLDYKSTDNVFSDHIQRVTNFDPTIEADDSIVQTLPLNAENGTMYFSLPKGGTLEDGVVTATKDNNVSFSLGYDAKMFRSCLAGAEESAVYKLQYRDLSNGYTDETKSLDLTYDKNKQKFTFAMPSGKIEIMSVYYTFNGDQKEYCGLPQFVTMTDSVDLNDTNMTQGEKETYEQCVARGGTEIGCRIGMHKISKYYATNMSYVQVYNNYAYIYTNRGYLRIVDYSDITNPIEVSFTDLGLTGGYMEIIGDYLYSYNKIINISNKKHPFVESGITANYALDSMKKQISNNIIFSFTNKILTVTNVENPKQPTIIYQSSSLWKNNIGIYSWIVENNYLYVTIIDYTEGNREFRLVAIDISTPNNPKVVSKYKISSPLESMTISNGYLYGISTENDKKIFKVFDLHDSSYPTLKSSIAINSNISNDIRIKGNKAYIRSFEDIKVIDISNKINLKLLNEKFILRNNSIDITNNLLYVISNYNELTLYDISKGLNSHEYFYINSNVKSLEIDDQYMYLSIGNEGIKKFNISSSNNISEIAETKDFNSSYITITANKIFSADYNDGFNIYDKKTLHLLQHMDIKKANYITVKEDFAYVSTYNDTLKEVNLKNMSVTVENKSHPIKTCMIENKLMVLDKFNTYPNKYIGIEGVLRTNSGYHDIACTEDGFWSTFSNSDISGSLIFTKSNPNLIIDKSYNSNIYKDIHISNDTNYIELQNNYLFIGSRNAIEVIDISNKNNPYRVADIDRGYGGSIFKVKGDYIYSVNNQHITSYVSIINWKMEMKKYSYYNSYHHPITYINLVNENVKDYTIVQSKFTKEWTFDQDISNFDIQILSNTYRGISVNDFIKEDKTLKIELNPHSSRDINKLVLMFKNNGNFVKVNNSKTFWSLTKTKESHPPRLADAQSTTFSTTDESFEIKTYDQDRDSVTLTVIDDAGGDVTINGTNITATFSDGKESHVIKVELNDGKESVIKEFTVLSPTQNSIENFYSDVDENSPYFNAIAFGTQKGVIEGDTVAGVRSYRPNDNTSMAEVLKIVLKTAQKAGYIDLGGSSYYRDVYPKWAMPYYTYARDIDAIDKEVSDLSAIYPTNEEIAKLIVKILKLDEKVALKDDNITFSDEADFSSDKMLYYAKLTKIFGLFMTKDSANPKKPIKRGELAEVIEKIFMMPKAKLTVTPNSFEYGGNITIVLNFRT